MTQEQFEKLLSLLKEIGSEAYNICNTKVNADIVLSIFFLGISIIALVLVSSILYERVKNEEYDWDSSSAIILVIISAIIIVTGIIVGIYSFLVLMNSLLAPQYQTLLCLSNLVR